MLPLSLLRTAQGHPMLVELKNGETYNGTLVSCDSWMNLHLREVDGTRFWQMRECYVRGNTIKYLRIPDEVLDKVKEESVAAQRKDKNIMTSGRGRGRGGSDRGGRGRGGAGGERGRGRGGRGGGGGERGGAAPRGGGDRGGRGGRGGSRGGPRGGRGH